MNTTGTGPTEPLQVHEIMITNDFFNFISEITLALLVKIFYLIVKIYCNDLLIARQTDKQCEQMFCHFGN